MFVESEFNNILLLEFQVTTAPLILAPVALCSPNDELYTAIHIDPLWK